jgi:hypothetical protein
MFRFLTLIDFIQQMPLLDMLRYQPFMNGSIDIVSFRYFLTFAYSESPSDTPQVRGTPASGKTMLAQLLGQYLSQQEPDVDVIWADEWPIQEVKDIGGYRPYLKRLGWKEGQKTVFIFDEAQTSYEDSVLWNGFFKSIHAYDDRRAITFASYGSPCSRITMLGTSIELVDSQRVTLRPIDHEDGLQPAGLLFSRIELDDLISRLCSGHHYFHQSFLDAIFDLTGGHVGAIYDLVKTITGDDVSLL